MLFDFFLHHKCIMLLKDETHLQVLTGFICFISSCLNWILITQWFYWVNNIFTYIQLDKETKPQTYNIHNATKSPSPSSVVPVKQLKKRQSFRLTWEDAGEGVKKQWKHVVVCLADRQTDRQTDRGWVRHTTHWCCFLFPSWY